MVLTPQDLAALARSAEDVRFGRFVSDEQVSEFFKMNGMDDDNENEDDEEELEALKAIIEIMKKVKSFSAKERIVSYLMSRFELWDEE